MSKISLTLLLTLATPALAQPPAQICLPSNLCVVDSRGTQVGILGGESLVYRKYNGTYYQFIVSGQTSTFLYTTSNCAGTAYLPYDDDYLPVVATLDSNSVLYAPTGTSTYIAVESYLSNGACYPYSSAEFGTYRSPVGVAEVLDAKTPKTWVPPYSVTDPKW